MSTARLSWLLSAGWGTWEIASTQAYLTITPELLLLVSDVSLDLVRQFLLDLEVGRFAEA